MKRAIAHSLAARLMALGPVEARSMFSGHGLFLDGICFALVTHDTVFLKVDGRNRPDFERAGMGPFRPWADRDTALVTFYEAPAAVVKDVRKFAAWSAKALAAARDYRAKKKPKKPRR
ncbi:MAG: TfoX/Sxy family protein [Alphaproteobacteria bacterium]